MPFPQELREKIDAITRSAVDRAEQPLNLQSTEVDQDQDTYMGGTHCNCSCCNDDRIAKLEQNLRELLSRENQTLEIVIELLKEIRSELFNYQSDEDESESNVEEDDSNDPDFEPRLDDMSDDDLPLKKRRFDSY